MKNRIKKLFAILLTLTVLCGLAVLPTGIMSSAANILQFADLQDGDTLEPGTYYTDDAYLGFEVGLLFQYNDGLPSTENYGPHNLLGFNETVASYTNQPYEANGILYHYEITIPDFVYHFDANTLSLDFNTTYEVPLWTIDQFNSSAFVLYAVQAPTGSVEAENENGEDFWKWWRNAARLTREQKTVTLNVPADIDNTVIPTFFFTAIKEANANVTLNINGETYSLNTNNLPAYYPWASEVSVEVLK